MRLEAIIKKKKRVRYLRFTTLSRSYKWVLIGMITSGYTRILQVRCGLGCGSVYFNHCSQNVVNSTVISRTPQESPELTKSCNLLLNK